MCREPGALGDVSLSAAGEFLSDRPRESGVVRGYHRSGYIPVQGIQGPLHHQVPVLGGDHGLGQPAGAGVAGVQHDGHPVVNAVCIGRTRRSSRLEDVPGTRTASSGLQLSGACSTTTSLYRSAETIPAVPRSGGGGDTGLDGWARSVSGERVHRAAVALAEVRGGGTCTTDGTFVARAGNRRVDRVLQRRATALGTPVAGRASEAYRASRRPDGRWRNGHGEQVANCGFRGQRASGCVIRCGELSTICTDRRPPSPGPPPPVTATCF